MNRTLPALLSLTLLGCGGLDLSFKVPLPETCGALEDQAFAAPPSPGPVAISQRFEHTFDPADLEELEARAGVEAHLRSFTFTAAEGTFDLAFLESVSLRLPGDEARGLPALLLGSYERPGEGPVTSVTLTLTGEDVVAYLRDGRVELEVELLGTVPESGFSVDAQLCAQLVTTHAL